MNRYVSLVAAALLCGGCVPVTEPLAPVDKAEQDKDLIGTWAVKKSKGQLVQAFEFEALEVSAPAVKGNPKGLMRWSTTGKSDTMTAWFYFTTIGKDTYATILLAEGDREVSSLDKEGGYAKWLKEKEKKYFVFKVARAGDKLTIDCGNYETFVKLMTDAKIGHNGNKHFWYYHTPAGWLREHLEKTGPAKLYDGSSVIELERKK
ncbi:MAG: hypothetical protein FJ304_16805 [Planctomycetes bacterium]|nr:hypothetical protein [Planctomycetota bacterium]